MHNAQSTRFYICTITLTLCKQEGKECHIPYTTVGGFSSPFLRPPSLQVDKYLSL